MFGRLRGRLLWALLVIGALTACVAVPAALAQPPYTLTIQNVGSTTNVSCGGSPTMTCVATGDGAVLSTTDLDNDLNGVTDPTVTKVVVGDASTTTTIVVDDPVSGTNPLEFAAAAETTGSVTLQAPTVTFDDGVTGSGNLTISGNGVFTGSSSIDSLDVDGTTSLAGSISTTASQTYADAVSLTGDTTLATTGGTGQVTFDSTVDGGVLADSDRRRRVRRSRGRHHRAHLGCSLRRDDTRRGRPHDRYAVLLRRDHARRDSAGALGQQDHLPVWIDARRRHRPDHQRRCRVRRSRRRQPRAHLAVGHRKHNPRRGSHHHRRSDLQRRGHANGRLDADRDSECEQRQVRLDSRWRFRPDHDR